MITPDTKDWTWVLHKPCPECGLDTRSISPEEVPTLLRDNAAAWHTLLTGPTDPRPRPYPDTWSPLEYACHVRDVCRIFDERLVLMLTQDDPYYPNWDQDETALKSRYADQDPATVAAELLAAARTLADRFTIVHDWTRTGTRGDGAHFTIATFARYFIHDPLHHLHDATGAHQYPAPGERSLRSEP